MRTLGKIFLVLIALVMLLTVVLIVIGHLSNRIQPKTVLTLRVEGEVKSRPAQDELTELLAGSRISVPDIIEALDRAGSDPRITGLELRVGESTMGIAAIQEVRQKIREFNRKGKFSVAYLEFGTNRSYYLASACQTVILLPTSLLHVRGLMASTTFLRGTFDKLAVYPDFLHIGDYKNATNIYTEKKYTAAHREADQMLLEDIARQYFQGLAEARGIKLEEMQKVIARGPFTAQEAMANKLVDRTAYDDEVRDLVKQRNGGSETRLSLSEYLRRTERAGHTKLAVIYATGAILPGRSGDSPLAGEVMGSETIAEQFRRAREDSSIKAVILRVDSPGGVSFASEAIRRELLLTKRQKPVVVSMSDVAASGGYWIAMSANRIVAQPGTITGSIGIFAGKFNILGLYEKLGLTKDSITTTDNSTIDWPFQNFTPAQRESIMKYMRDVYGEFIKGVAEGRHMQVEAVDKVGQGHVWTGERAKQLGLVDELGGLDTAIGAAKTLAKIPAGEAVTLVILPAPKPLFEALRDLFGNASVMARGAALERWTRSVESLARIPVWTLLPAVPEVQ